MHFLMEAKSLTGFSFPMVLYWFLSGILAIPAMALPVLALPIMALPIINGKLGCSPAPVLHRDERAVPHSGFKQVKASTRQQLAIPIRRFPIRRFPIRRLPITQVGSLDDIDQWLTRLALAHLPRQFTNDKQWGMQVEKRRGVQVVDSRGKLDVRSKKELVNHGNWRRYSASLRNPEQEFQIQLRNIQELVDGGIGLEVHCKGHLDFVAQQSNWKNGVRLLNLTATGHTEVEVQIELEVRTEFVGRGLLPDVIIRPAARQARLYIYDFRVDRIGKIGGELAQQIGREARKQLQTKLAEQEQKIVAKINQEFGKKENGYRFSWSDSGDSRFHEVFSKLLNTRHNDRETLIK
jgi:hypothetical protein